MNVYFVSDVHLGLPCGTDQEARFLTFLKSIDSSDTEAVYLLGDIWDFWYEYRDVVPKEGIRAVAELCNLREKGVRICFLPGNHDIWTFHWFENLGFTRIEQPCTLEYPGLKIVVGHGDGLGKTDFWYSLMLKVFHSKVCQALFSSLHPTIAFGIARRWSRSNRRKHSGYKWRAEKEPLYEYACSLDADVFIFGHYHHKEDCILPSGARLIVLDDWLESGSMPYLVLNLCAGRFTFGGSLPKIEK